MSSEIVQFLMTKFTSALEDVKKDRHQVPLKKLFEQIEFVLRTRIAPSMPNIIRDALMDSLYKLDEAFTECRVLYEKRKRRGLPHYTIKEAYSIYRIKRDLLSIKRKLQAVEEASASLPTAELRGEEHTPEITGTPYGLETEKKKIISSLQQECNNGVHAVGIVGMGGSGKTTLAKLVYHDKAVKTEFIPRIWVRVSSKSDNKAESTKNIVQNLLKELGDSDDDDDDDDAGENHKDHEQENAVNDAPTENDILDKLLVALYKQLYGKKYLIVFDDVWHIDEWYELLVNSKVQEGDHLGLPRGYGGAVMVISRLEQDVGEMVGKENLHHPPSVLDDDHCRSIFSDVLQEKGITMADEPILATMKAEIVENCNGLPLAAKTLGNIFSQKILDEKTLVNYISHQIHWEIIYFFAYYCILSYSSFSIFVNFLENLGFVQNLQEINYK